MSLNPQYTAFMLKLAKYWGLEIAKGVGAGGLKLIFSVYSHRGKQLWFDRLASHWSHIIIGYMTALETNIPNPAVENSRKQTDIVLARSQWLFGPQSEAVTYSCYYYFTSQYIFSNIVVGYLLQWLVGETSGQFSPCSARFMVMNIKHFQQNVIQTFFS